MKNRRKKRVSPAFLVTLTLIILGLGLTLAGNGFASTGFQARGVEKQIKALIEENKLLEIQAANLQSIQKLSESVGNSASLVPVSKLKHIEPAK